MCLCFLSGLFNMQLLGHMSEETKSLCRQGKETKSTSCKQHKHTCVGGPLAKNAVTNSFKPNANI